MAVGPVGDGKGVRLGVRVAVGDGTLVGVLPGVEVTVAVAVAVEVARGVGVKVGVKVGGNWIGVTSLSPTSDDSSFGTTMRIGTRVGIGVDVDRFKSQAARSTARIPSVSVSRFMPPA